MVVTILGTDYEIIKDATIEEYSQLRNCDGFTDFSTKKIVIAKFEVDENSIEDLGWYEKKVLRHEIVHAFFFESGLSDNCDYAKNEELIDWIASQFGKILCAFINTDSMEENL